MNLVSEGKKHVVLKSRKLWFEGAFFIVLLLFGLFLFPL